MNSLRFLLVHRNPEQSVEIAGRLARANHTVLPTADLAEAADALTIERFDAVLMEPAFDGLELQQFGQQLRSLERTQKKPSRMPVLALAEEVEEGYDGAIAQPIDPFALTEAVSKLARALNRASNSDSEEESQANLVVIDPEKFREQVGGDEELMIEIIDLFLFERQKQEPLLRAALAGGDWEELSRLAHTIKGSLGSLAAMRARAHAQDLEYAAKHNEEEVCRESLASLERDLAELEPELLALRHG